MTVRRIKRNNLGLHDEAQAGHIADLGPEGQDYTDDAALLATAIRFIPSYQHIWDPLAARVSKHENGAGVFFTGSLWLCDQPSPDTTIQVLQFVQRSERNFTFSEMSIFERLRTKQQ